MISHPPASSRSRKVVPTCQEFGVLGVVNYYGYRYFHPELGRWISRDPIGEEGGLNLYAIFGNNATNRMDFIGLNANADGNINQVNPNEWTDENRPKDLINPPEVPDQKGDFEYGCWDCKCTGILRLKFDIKKARDFQLKEIDKGGKLDRATLENSLNLYIKSLGDINANGAEYTGSGNSITKASATSKAMNSLRDQAWQGLKDLTSDGANAYAEFLKFELKDKCNCVNREAVEG